MPALESSDRQKALGGEKPPPPPFPPPSSGRIAVKVINHYGDEVLKVYEV